MASLIFGSCSAAVCALSVVCLAGLLAPSSGYPNGAPMTTCGSLIPGHGFAQTGPSPYNLIIRGSTYSHGQTVEVIVAGGLFQGLILQARRRRDKQGGPVGTWQGPTLPHSTKTMRCAAPHDTITHANTDRKRDSTFIWIAPNQDVGDVYFVVTVAEKKLNWWPNIESSRSLSYSGGRSTTRNTTPSTRGGGSGGHANIPGVGLSIFAVVSTWLFLRHL